MTRGQSRDPFTRLDRNGDGSISLNEFETPDLNMMERSDFDGDGNVTRAELEQAVARMSGRRRR